MIKLVRVTKICRQKKSLYNPRQLTINGELLFSMELVFHVMAFLL